MYIFPGVALGAYSGETRIITDHMLMKVGQEGTCLALWGREVGAYDRESPTGMIIDHMLIILCAHTKR